MIGEIVRPEYILPVIINNIVTIPAHDEPLLPKGILFPEGKCPGLCDWDPNMERSGNQGIFNRSWEFDMKTLRKREGISQ